MTFELRPLLLTFQARDTVRFPPAKAGNVLRGAFGAALLADPSTYARLFKPVSGGAGPSGLADPPRPFVLRARRLDDATIAPGEPFSFGVHIFETRDPELLSTIVEAFAELGRKGLGPGNGCAELRKVEQVEPPGPIFSNGAICSCLPPPRAVALDPERSASRVLVHFVTPTELKGDGSLIKEPEFGVLFARIRDRVSTLRSLYGAGTLPIDFRAMGERAAQVRIARSRLNQVSLERRSARSGQVHPLGGFVGEVCYEGELGEFLPYLEAARWTGVGRQTVWGKGEIAFEVQRA